MADLAMKLKPAAPGAAKRGSATPEKKQKLTALLVTADDALWPQVSTHFRPQLIGKQVDSVDELMSSVPSGQAAILMWDARGEANPAAVMSRMQMHSPRFAIIALDDVSSASAWTLPAQHRQIVSMISIPIAAEELTAAIAAATDEVNTRIALLGHGAAPQSQSQQSGAEQSSGAAPKPAQGSAGAGRKLPVMAMGAAALILVAGAAFMLLRQGAAPLPTSPTPSATTASAQSFKAAAGTEDRVDALIEKAQQAMLERHFIDPVEGSALSFYREAQILNPGSGEARQGMQRVAEVLFARVQTALDERKLDVALQALETARSIDAADSRLTAFDERIAAMRAELGPAQIQAALVAQNFDRAGQLIDQAARARSLSAAKLTELREELRRRRAETDSARLMTLIEARLQQDRLIDPQNDSAGYYLEQARAAGVPASLLQPRIQDFIKRGTQAVRAALEQRRFDDADRLLAELHTAGMPASTLAGLQHDLTAARGAQSHDKPDTQHLLDLARARLARGSVTDPDNDSALTYVNQLRAADPQNSAVTQISGAVQAQIIDRARMALDAADVAKAGALLQLAAGLGASPDLTALGERLAQAKAAATTEPEAPEVAEKTLKRLGKLEPDYPRRALTHNVEGWVDLGFTVAADGQVVHIKVLDSKPAGTFDDAAIKALTRMRYQPYLDGGKATAVSTKLRVAFRVAT